MIFYGTHLSHVHKFNVSSYNYYNTHYHAHKLQVKARAWYQCLCKNHYIRIGTLVNELNFFILNIFT